MRCEHLIVEHVGSGTRIVDDVSISLRHGQVMGLVGESGSGKTTLALALLGYARPGARLRTGRMFVDGTDVFGHDEHQWQQLRGRLVAYVPQDPATALNPALRLRRQLDEVLVEHLPDMEADSRRARIRETLTQVGLPSDDEFVRRYPHQLSGGQQQRVALAIAFVTRPQVLVLDEPTTGLDVTTQRRVLDLIRHLTTETGVASLYVSHDLGAVAALADSVAVMYAGRIVEQGTATKVLTDPQHPYTRRLIAATPRLAGATVMAGIAGRAPSLRERPAGCSFAPRCQAARPECSETVPDLVAAPDGHQVACVVPYGDRIRSEPVLVRPTRDVGEPSSRSILAVRQLSATYGRTPVITALDLDVPHSSCVAIVGESGSGKSTLARCIAGLHSSVTGSVLLDGTPLEADVGRRSPLQRQRVQYIFQNPYGALNPRRTVGEIVRQPLDVYKIGHRDARNRLVASALDAVSLGSRALHRLPAQLSGGERQRVAIARALVSEPDVLICDEVTSALDVSVQASIVALLLELQRDRSLTMLFITHNLPLVRNIADSVAVLQRGTVVESGPCDRVLSAPVDPYTQRLLSDTPTLDGDAATLQRS
jgi:peptide/nickel transport system ATP-binding protein